LEGAGQRSLRGPDGAGSDPASAAALASFVSTDL
jgi:hypothetical protein